MAASSLALAKQVVSSGPFIPGGSITYLVSVSATGGAASGVVVTDSATGFSNLTFSNTPGTGTFTFTNVGPLGGTATANSSITATRTFLVTGTIASTGFSPGNAQVSNTVSATVTPPTTPPPPVTVTTPIAPGLSLTKTGPAGPITPGQQVVYTINVQNISGGVQTVGNVTDTLPSSLTFVSSTPASTTNAPLLTFPVGTLAPGAIFPITITALLNSSITSSTSVSNTATVFDPSTTPPTELDATAIFTVGAPSADLEILKTGPLCAKSCDLLTYTITLTNNGPSDAMGVMVTDTLSCDSHLVKFMQSNGSPFFPIVHPRCHSSRRDIKSVTVGPATLPASSTVQFVISLRNKKKCGVVTNTATVSSSTPDPNTANNTATVFTKIKKARKTKEEKCQI